MKVDNRLWYLGSVIVVVGVVTAGWVVGVAPQLAAADSSKASLVSSQAQNKELTARLSTLNALQSEKSAKESELKAVEAQIPTTLDGAGFLAQVNSASSSSGTTITNVSFGQAVPYAVPTTASTAGASAAPGTAVTKSKIDTSKLLPYTNPLVTSSNLLVIPVSISASGSQNQLESLLSSLRDMNRELLITQINLQGAANGLQLIVTADIYTVVS